MDDCCALVACGAVELFGSTNVGVDEVFGDEGYC